MLKTSPTFSSSATSPSTGFRRAPPPSSQEHATEPSRPAPDALTPDSQPSRAPGSLSSAASATSLPLSADTSGASIATVPSDLIPSQCSWGPPASASISASSSALASATVSALVPTAASSSASSSTDPSTTAGQDEPSKPGQHLPMTSATADGAPEPPHACPAAAQLLQQDAPSPNKRRGHPSMHDITHDVANDTDAVVAQARAAPDRPSSPNTPGTSKRAKPDEQPAKVLPRRYELCHVDDMVQLIAHMLGELIMTNDAIRISNGGLTRFHSRTAPGISVRDYLHRLARHATLTPPLLLAMVYYIDRLCASYPEFTINTLTVHRFLITAATVAAKGLSDSFWNNSTYARVGGVRVAELKLLELEFLYRVDWKIVPNPDVLVAYYQGLVHRCPGYTCEPGPGDDENGGSQGAEEGMRDATA